MKIEYYTIFNILRNKKPVIIKLCILSLSGSLFAIAVPWFTRLQIEVLESKTPAAAFIPAEPVYILAAILVLTAVMKLLQSAFSGIENILTISAREQFIIESDRVLYNKMESLDAGFFQNPKNRRLLYVLFDVGNLAGSFLQFCMSQGKIIISFLGIFPIIAVVDIRILAVLIAASGGQLLVLRFRIRRENSYRLYKERRLADINEMKFLLRYHYHQLLGVSGEERIMPRYWSRLNEVVTLEAGQEKMLFRYQMLNALLENSALILTSFTAGFLVLRSGLSIGSFTMVTMYVVYLQSCFTGINQNISEWYRMRSVFIQFGFFLSMKQRVAMNDVVSRSDPVTGSIKIMNISFRYPNLSGEECGYIAHLVEHLNIVNTRREIYGTDLSLVREWQRVLEENSKINPLVLNGASCSFNRGEITALVGRNGSGKTTMMNLLMRSYDPESGEITIGEEPMKKLHPSFVRHTFSMVPQTPFLLESFSIRDNILLGAPRGVTDEEIWNICGELDIADVLRRFPRGLDSLIGDEVNLSGGQSQLLAIARIMAQDRPFIILDEGTNQLDAEHELRILDILQRKKSRASVIIITHRMTTARKADVIHVMENGNIIESGKHDYLLSIEGGRYRHFWEIQVVN